MVKERKHPKGLMVLFFIEMWERYNYYGMRAILVLFMTKAMLFDKVFSSNLYGSYTSLVFLTPLLGGYMSDRYWGNKRSIAVGGIVMAIGEFVLFFCGLNYHKNPELSSMLFFTGLGLMIAGTGFFKPNNSSMIGQLYPKGDKRIDSAYTIFYMGINVGAALGPIVCGFLGDTGNPADFKWAFLAGGTGMIISIIIQRLFHNKYVRDPDNKILGLTPNATQKKIINPFFIITGFVLLSCITICLLYIDVKVVNYLVYLLVGALIFSIIIIFGDKKLTVIEKQRIGVIFIVSFFVVFFWSAYEQAGASLTFFADEQTQRNLGFLYVPASFFQSLNSIFIILLAPVFAWFWLKLGKKDPSSPAKMAIGLFLLSSGFLWIAFGVNKVVPGIKVSMIWLTGMYFLHTCGELCLSPIGLSMVNKLAPFRFASLLMAVWFLANSFANKLAGVLSALYPDNKTTSFLSYKITNMHDFFMLFVFMSGFAALILLLLTTVLKRMLHTNQE
jgi:proton-dependent oligopeptide transporter, POT family